MRTRTSFCLSSLLTAATAVVLPAQQLVYNGGPVVSSPQYYIVLWGSGSYDTHISGTGSPSVATFLQNAGTAFSWLDGDYNTVNASFNGTKTNQHLVNGTYRGSFTITPSTTASTVDDIAIQAELAAQIAAGHLPAPANDALSYGITSYLIFFPPGITITQGGSSSCVAGGFCAYHGTVRPASGPTYFYSVMPDMQAGSGCATGCGNSTTFGNYTSVLSHEVAETLTDADVGISGNASGPPLAWYDNTNGEIGDICNASQGSFVGSDNQTYTVQLLWSNSRNSCTGPQPVAPPTNDFSLSANPTTMTFKQGAGGTSTINSVVASGNPVTINLSASGLPTGVSASFSPTSITSGNSSTLTLSSTAAVAPGNYMFTVTGANTTGFMTFGAGTPVQGNDFSIGATPSSISVSQGSGGSVAISTAAIGGLADTLSLSISGLPSGVTASFSPSTLSSGQASTLHLIASNGASIGTVTVAIAASAASGSHTATFSLTVTPPDGGSGIVNGGFETGELTGWTASGKSSVVSSSPHSGGYAALVGGTLPTNGDSSLSQTFIAPAGAAQLSLWYDVHCYSVSYDWATVTLRDNTLSLSSTILPKTCTKSGQWSNLAVAIIAGHSYTLTLTNHDDAYPGDASYTLFDDVTFSSPVSLFTVITPAWTQIGANQLPETAPPLPPKPHYHGTAFTTRMTPSEATLNAVNGSSANHTVSITLTVTASVSISISNIPASAVYGGSFTPTFTYSGNGTTSVTSGTPGTCTVSGGIVSFVGVGTCTLTAHATAGSSSPAVDGSPQSFTIGQATTTISINNIPVSPVYGGSFTPTFAYTGDGTTSVTSGTTSTCTVSGGVVSFAGAGACTLTAHATAGTNYKAVDGAAQQFTIGLATTTISISNLPANAVYGGSFTPTFAYTGDGTTSVTSGTTSTCTVSGGVVSFVGVGACTLTAHATAGTKYKAVDGAAQQFTIGQATTTISINNIPVSPVYGGSFTPTFAYTGDGTTSVTSGTTSTCTVSGGVVSFVGVGACTLTAHATAGTNYKAVDGAAQQFTIGQATTTISISNLPANAVYGGSFKPTFAYTGDGTTSVTSGTTSTCAVSGGVVSFVGVGACTLIAHATAGTKYKAVDGVTQSFTIKPLTSTVVVSPAAGQYSDAVTLTATVGPSGAVFSGSLQFQVNNVNVGAPVSVAGSGAYSTPYTITVAAGSYPITAVLTPTSPLGTGAMGTNTLTVTTEDATITPAAGNPQTAQVSAPGGTANSITLKGNVREAADASPGDISKAVVTVSLVPAVSAAPTISCAVTNAAGALTAVCSKVPVNAYTVQWSITGSYYQGPQVNTELAVYDPSLASVIGGGTLQNNGVPAGFAIDAKYQNSGALKGGVIYFEHRSTGDVTIIFTSLTSMSIVGTTAVIRGVASVNGAGAYPAQVTATDNGEPGINRDLFGLQAAPVVSFNPVTITGGEIKLQH